MLLYSSIWLLCCRHPPCRSPVLLARRQPWLWQPLITATLAPKCRKLDLYKEMGIWNFSDLFSRKREVPRWPDLLIGVGTLRNFWDIHFSARKLFEGRRKSIYCLRFFQFLQKRLYVHNSAENTEFLSGRSSLVLLILVCWQQAMVSWNRDTKGRVCLSSGSFQGDYKKWQFSLGQTDSLLSQIHTCITTTQLCHHAWHHCFSKFFSERQDLMST